MQIISENHHPVLQQSSLPNIPRNISTSRLLTFLPSHSICTKAKKSLTGHHDESYLRHQIRDKKWDEETVNKISSAKTYLRSNEWSQRNSLLSLTCCCISIRTHVLVYYSGKNTKPLKIYETTQVSPSSGAWKNAILLGWISIQRGKLPLPDVITIPPRMPTTLSQLLTALRAVLVLSNTRGELWFYMGDIE